MNKTERATRDDEEHRGTASASAASKKKTLDDVDNESIKSFSSSGKEESVRDMISKLKFISKIREDEKIDVKRMFIVKPDPASIIHRTLISRETRDDTYDFLKTTIDQAISMISLYIGEKITFNSAIAKMLVENLKNTREGLENIGKTYEKVGDLNFVCKINSLIETMNVKIQIQIKNLNVE